MATIDLAFSDYVRNLRCSAQAAAVIAARLAKAAPIDINPDQRAALIAIDARADDVAAVQSERDRLGPARLRGVLSAYSNGWSACHEALLAAARVPREVSDRGARALALLNSVFPDGISFTQLDAEAAWSEGNRRVERVRTENLEATLDELIGADFFSTVETVTANLADAIGTGERAQIAPSTTALQEALSRFGRAVGFYGRLMVGSCNEDDPASVERFLRAMAPIDAHRNAVRSGSDLTRDDSEEPSPVTPVVTVTPVAPVAPVTPAAPVTPQNHVVLPSPFLPAAE